MRESRYAAATILELYKAIFPDNRFRPGIIASTQTFGDLLSWLALIRIYENPSLKAEVQKAARMGKNKKKHQPKFVYYRRQSNCFCLCLGVWIMKKWGDASLVLLTFLFDFSIIA